MEDNGKIILRLKKSEGEEIRVTEREYNGKDYVDIRQFFAPRKITEFLPTRKGVTMSRDLLLEMVTKLSGMKK